MFVRILIERHACGVARRFCGYFVLALGFVVVAERGDRRRMPRPNCLKDGQVPL